MDDFIKLKNKLLKNKEIRKEYDRLGPRYQMIQQIIDARNKSGLTQKKLATKMGTKQTSISRFESGSLNPTLDFLHSLSRALGRTLVIKLV